MTNILALVACEEFTRLSFARVSHPDSRISNDKGTSQIWIIDDRAVEKWTHFNYQGFLCSCVSVAQLPLVLLFTNKENI